MKTVYRYLIRVALAAFYTFAAYSLVHDSMKVAPPGSYGWMLLQIPITLVVAHIILAYEIAYSPALADMGLAPRVRRSLVHDLTRYTFTAVMAALIMSLIGASFRYDYFKYLRFTALLAAIFAASCLTLVIVYDYEWRGVI